MSRWTYVTGWIKVNVPGRTQDEKDYILKTVLNHLPIVRGSEREMYFHTFRAGGYSTTEFYDEYGQRTNNLDDYFYKGYKSQKDGCLRTQDSYYIFIEGNFRDTYFNKQYRQLMKWITRLAKRLYIEDIDVLYRDDMGHQQRIVFEPNGYDFAEIYVWENNWCDHLLWWTNKEE